MQARGLKNGYTLVELSIVLVIIGLLVGGVLAAQSLVAGQRLRQVLTDARTYAIAMQQFKQKYGFLAGDFPTATSVWGSDSANCTSSLDTTGGTCNGNGDGQLATAGAASAPGEIFELWRQLVLGGYISGNYTGINGPGNANFNTVPGVNVPQGSINSTAYAYYSWGNNPSGTSFYAGDYTNVLVFGKQAINSWPSYGPLTPSEALEIDTKADDGQPAFGLIRTFTNTYWNGTCVSSNTPSTAVYNSATSVYKECGLVFLQGFAWGNTQQ